MKLRFGACPKCQGDLQVRRDVYGMFSNCLQCGLQLDLETTDPALPGHGVEPALIDLRAREREQLARAA